MCKYYICNYLQNNIISISKIYICFICFFFFSCKQKQTTSIAPAFYHWQTKFQLTSYEKNRLAALNVEKIYVKFFDIDWDFQQNKIIPKAIIDLDSSFFLQKNEIIPSIFITNRTLENAEMHDVLRLAKQIYDKIINILSVDNVTTIREIQIDCDWTLSTKGKYFELLSDLEDLFKKHHIQLSATIRLHQVKYSHKTGVPPVARGMLMCYNMGDLDDPNTANSILELGTTKAYLDSLRHYPLSLDVALPLFGWGVLLRDGKAIKLINQLSANEMRTAQLFEQQSETIFQIKKNTYFRGYSVYEGDVIRLESVTSNLLIETSKLLQKNLRQEPRSIAFYHLDSLTIKPFSDESLQAIFDCFRH